MAFFRYKLVGKGETRTEQCAQACVVLVTLMGGAWSLVFVWAMLSPGAPVACARMGDGAWRAMCEHKLHAPTRDALWAAYEANVRACKWTETPTTFTWARDAKALDAPADRHGIKEQRPGYQRLCEATGGWMHARYGDFTTRGGYDWSFVDHEDFGKLTALLESGSRAYVVARAHAGAQFDAHGVYERPLGLPPIHVHHVNTNPETSSRLTAASEVDLKGSDKL